jgi:predicted RNA-binding protein with PUA-like domain
MNHWLVKSEPSTYAWETLVKERRTRWDGVRNFQARNNLQAMEKGDLCLFYHSGVEPAVVGIAKVVRASYPDPTGDDPRWVAVDLAPHRALEAAVTLAALKADPRTRGMALLRQGRLSVSPVTAPEFAAVLELAT